MTEAAADRPKKREQRFDDKLAEIIVETAAFVGPVIAKKHEHHKICEQNRAYAGFRKGA